MWVSSHIVFCLCKIMCQGIIAVWVHMCICVQVLCEMRELRVLYLHGNSIFILSEVDRLGVLPHLHTITLHGNAIESNKAYRWRLSFNFKFTLTHPKPKHIVHSCYMLGCEVIFFSCIVFHNNIRHSDNSSQESYTVYRVRTRTKNRQSAPHTVTHFRGAERRKPMSG